MTKDQYAKINYISLNFQWTVWKWNLKNFLCNSNNKILKNNLTKEGQTIILNLWYKWKWYWNKLMT